MIGGGQGETGDKIKKSIDTEEWFDKLNKISVTKTQLNKLIMNFFVVEGKICHRTFQFLILFVEGYKEAAEKFQKESGTESTLEEYFYS